MGILKKYIIRPVDRIQWIDSLIGFAMLLVVLGHCLPWLTNFFVIVNPFKMPLFFAISGYLFNEKQDIRILIKKLSKRIVLPWIIIGSIVTTLYYSTTDRSILHEIYNVFINGKGIWWFLPCFLWGEVFFYYLTKYSDNDFIIVLLSFLCFLGGVMLYRYKILNIMMINRALTSQLFFSLGYIYKRKEKKYGRIIVLYLLIAVYMVLVSISFSLYPGEVFNMSVCRYFDIPLNLLETTIGVFAFLALFSQKKQLKLLQYIGKSTFVIYMLHSWIIFLVKKGIYQFYDVEKSRFIIGLIVFFLSTSISCFAAEVFNRYFPILTGRQINN